MAILRQILLPARGNGTLYNVAMPNLSYELRVCDSCGLRYPLVEGHPFGTRCPSCMGETHVQQRRSLVTENREPFREERASPRKEESSKDLAVLLDNIRSAWNVGSILRSADGFGFTHAFFCGITPTADHEAVGKTSLGAEDSVPWSYHKDALKLAKGLKSEGRRIYALEDDVRAIDIRRAASAIVRSPREVLVLGNEVTGIDPDLLDLCDEVFHIPMQGEKKSFNVAIAFGIAAYALTVGELES